MVLITVLAMGLLTLASIELRKSRSGEAGAEARANARLALQTAIGQLQREMGPDRRVSAQAEMLGHERDGLWTGAWPTTAADGRPYLVRDPQSGSWIDRRESADAGAEARVDAWLVSGAAEPGAAERDAVRLVGRGSAGADESQHVRAPLVGVGGTGRLAWWTGDLGVRANLAVDDAHERAAGDDPSAAAYRKLLSQSPAESLLGDGPDFAPGEARRMASARSLGLAAGSDWAREHFHDFTVASRGVLADVRDGGLKRDLTAYFLSDGEIADADGLAGLSDDDPVLLDPAGSRLEAVAPRFGALRAWAGNEAPADGLDVSAVVPETDPSAAVDGDEFAFGNLSPTRLRGTTGPGLQPVLVEASNFTQISAYRLEPRADDVWQRFQLRHHLYPRVVLWNPYNVELTFPEAIVMIQGNGRQEMWTDNEHYDLRGRLVFRSQAQWLSFEGGRSTEFIGEDDEDEIKSPDDYKEALMNSLGYNDPYIGSYYFSLAETRFGPGECLVFSPVRSAEYSGRSVYRPDAYDLSENRLSAEVAPDPSRSYFVSASELDGGMDFRPVRFWYAPTPYWSEDGRGVVNQSEDNRVVVKRLNSTGPVTFEEFDNLPQLAYISASLQYGAGRQPRVAWDDQSKMRIELLDRDAPRPSLVPDVRTRDGVRLRWFDEHLSNRLNAGPMSDQTRFFEEALLGNWNPRAAYAVRSPWENIGGNLAVGGQAENGGGPWFFGAYTRDLYDGEVSWGGQEPRFADGRYLGNPFGPPQEGADRHILFELPREDVGVVSLGQLQHAKLSDFIWHPSFAVGNSLVDPRLGRDGMTRTVPDAGAAPEFAGFHADRIGWSGDDERSDGRDHWARHGRTLLHRLPEENHVVYDLSFEVNQALWDRFFLSTGDAEAKARFLDDPASEPLPNGRMTLYGDAAADDLGNHRRAARHLMLDGAFNVNSTRVEAWKAMLGSTREPGPEPNTRFARFLDGEAVRGDDDDLRHAAWEKMRTLSDAEIGRLAGEIVAEVKRRGPFVSLADFVNRRLASDETGLKGALQAAIDRAGINRRLESQYRLDNGESLETYQHPDHIDEPVDLAQTLKPDSKAWGAPGFLTQGDILQVLGPAIAARSDSFLIRAYGDARDGNGRVLARAWCQAEVQRVPEPVVADDSGLNPRDSGERTDFGRRFRIVSFRWLRPGEV